MGKVYGFQRAMDGLGSVLGAMLAFLLFPILGYRNIFLFAFVPAIIGTLIILFIKESKEYHKTNSGKERPQTRKKNQKVLENLRKFPPNLRLFILISALFTLGNFGYAFLLLKAKNIGLADNYVILFYILFYVVYLLCSIPAGAFSDKFGRKPVLIAGYVVFGLTSLGLIFASNNAALIIFFITYGVFFGLTDGVQRAFVVDLAPKDSKGAALGAFHTAIGLVALPGGFIAGFLWDSFGPSSTFAYALLLAMISLLLFTRIKNNKPPQKK
jgi:MFS family permease